MISMPPFFDFLAIQKIIKKSTPQKIDFFGIFGDFGHFFLQFLTILGPFWGPQEGKSENRDFVKIVLPPRREHDFQGSDPPKIDLECDFERRWCKKSMTTASGAILGSAFFAPGRFFVDFGLPLGSQTGHFGATFGRLSRLFGQLWATMCFSFDRGCSGTVLGSILNASGCLPGGIFREFWVILGVASVIRCTSVLFQLRPKFVQIPDQSLLSRWFWPWLACP